MQKKVLFNSHAIKDLTSNGLVVVNGCMAWNSPEAVADAYTIIKKDAPELNCKIIKIGILEID